MDRSQNLLRLQQETFDVCVIGGGASGAGCALDAVLRGYKVALIEKKDFASETSSKSTKLIHGGVRYLEQAFKKLDFAQLTQVRHGLEERHIVLRNAPHLANPLPLITPVESWWEGLYFNIGLKLYDWFAGNDSLPKSRWLTQKEVLQRIPTLSKKKLHSGVLYYDGQLDDARYCLAIVQSAAEAGAVVANYTAAHAFQKDDSGKINAVEVTDILAGKAFTIQARVIINCTGPFSDTLRLKANPALPPRMRPSKGVHAILPPSVLNSSDALLIPKTSDGRLMFAIPFEGGTLLGTTDTEYQNGTDEPVLEEEEVRFLLETLSPYLVTPPDQNSVRSGFGGLRPLLAADPTKSTKRLTRDHEVEHDDTSNLVSLLGGKWTTYRLMAQDTLDQVDRLFTSQRACRTADYPLAGGEDYSPEQWKEIQEHYSLSPETSIHLSRKYGSRVKELLRLTHDDAQLLSPLIDGFPYIKAEIVYAVRKEMAVTPRDALARRIRLEIADWEATRRCLPTVCDLMARELNWDQKTSVARQAEYEELLIRFAQKSGIN